MTPYSWSARPTPLLTPYIDRYWGWEGAVHLPRRLLPGTGAECLFHYASPFALNNQRDAQATLIAPRSAPVSISGGDTVGFVSVRFRSGRLRHLCGLPLAAIHDQERTVESIWGSDATHLVDTLRLAANHPQRISALDTFFLAQLARHHQQTSQGFDAVIDLLYYAPGTSIEAVAEQSGWTRRHIVRKFSDFYGITPKRFSRLARFNHTMRALALDASLDSLDTALGLGYFDQSHFIHETRALTGTTPGEIVSGLRSTSHFYNPPSRPIS